MSDELIGVIEDGAQIIAIIDDSQPVIEIEIKEAGPTGPDGKQGKVWLPDVDEDGDLTWELDDGQTQPEPANIRGPQGDAAEIDYDELAQHIDVAGMTTFTHEQALASMTWAIVHNLGFYPSVAAVTYGGNQIIGDVQYLDKNSLTVEFTVALSGFAYLS